jgi:hypothetical protein
MTSYFRILKSLEAGLVSETVRSEKAGQSKKKVSVLCTKNALNITVTSSDMFGMTMPSSGSITKVRPIYSNMDYIYEIQNLQPTLLLIAHFI